MIKSAYVMGLVQNQVRKYIKRHTGLSVKIERLKTKYNNYSSFFIPVTEPDRSKLLNPEVWPTCVGQTSGFNSLERSGC